MSHGLKSLARELPKHGRYGDTIVAHINPQEAALLKSLGGSGTINPTTGLPEFWGIGNIFKPVTQAVKSVQHVIGQTNPFNPGSAAGKITASIPGVSQLQNAATQVFQPLEKAVVQPASAGLAKFDKAVGNAVPGGWGTLGMVAASMIPGMQPLAMAGLGAINGSGVLRKGGSFNLQGAMMGGAMAYGLSSLAQYAQGAVPAGAESGAATLPVSEGASVLPGELGDIPVTTAAPTSAVPNPQPQINYSAAPGTGGYSQAIASGAAPSGVPTIASTPSLAEIAATRATQPGFLESVGNYVADIPNAVSLKASEVGANLSNAFDKATTLDTYKQFGTDYMNNVSKTGEGIKNLVGLGDTTASAASKLASTTTGINPVAAAAGTIYGGMGLAALEEQRNYLEQQKAANAITESEYNQAVAEIDRSIAVARNAVSSSPFSTTPSRDVSIGETYYDRAASEDNLYNKNTAPESRLYAKGGEVQGYFGGGMLQSIAPDVIASIEQSANNPQPASNPQPAPQIGYSGSGFFGGAISPAILSLIAQDMGSQANQSSAVKPSVNINIAPSDRSPMDLGATLYSKEDEKNSLYNLLPGKTFNMGGSVDGELGGDDMNTENGNMQNGMFAGGLPSYAMGGMPSYDDALRGLSQPAFNQGAVGGNQAFAEGGVARFLSGGGDGMSDSIPARINGKQEARLADGEFVIPADVVSHLGNGSSKAGAKQLYSMMDKVRAARTGNKKQGKQINPRKFLAA